MLSVKWLIYARRLLRAAEMPEGPEKQEFVAAYNLTWCAANCVSHPLPIALGITKRSVDAIHTMQEG